MTNIPLSRFLFSVPGADAWPACGAIQPGGGMGAGTGTLTIDAVVKLLQLATHL